MAGFAPYIPWSSMDRHARRARLSEACSRGVFFPRLWCWLLPGYLFVKLLLQFKQKGFVLLATSKIINWCWRAWIMLLLCFCWWWRQRKMHFGCLLSSWRMFWWMSFMPIIWLVVMLSKGSSKIYLLRNVRGWSSQLSFSKIFLKVYYSLLLLGYQISYFRSMWKKKQISCTFGSFGIWCVPCCHTMVFVPLLQEFAIRGQKLH